MTDEIKSENQAGHGDYERRDIGIAGVVYFILALALATALVHLALAGLYDFLDKRARTEQPAVSPLLNVPRSEDTRKIAPHYPDKVFPEPRLETDELTQLTGVRLNEAKILNSYGWVDEKAGTVRIPIERAMELEVQRLSVRGAEPNTSAATNSGTMNSRAMSSRAMNSRTTNSSEPAGAKKKGTKQ